MAFSNLKAFRRSSSFYDVKGQDIGASTGFFKCIYLVLQKRSHYVQAVQKLQCALKSKHHIINSHFKKNTLINRQYITSAEAQ